MRDYNKAGIESREYYVAGEDPCGYVVEKPNRWRTAINLAVQDGLQRATEVSESDVDNSVKAKAWQTYQLAREMAASVNRVNEAGLALLAARIQKVVKSIHA